MWIPSTSAVARAQESHPAQSESAPPVSRWDRAWALYVTFGIGTPVGLLGVQLERRLTTWLAAQAGVGTGIEGAQGALMARLRLPAAPTLNLGIGFSGGDYEQRTANDLALSIGHGDAPEYDLHFHPAYWNNYEVSLEHRAQTGFTLRAFVGGAVLLNPGDVEYECNACEVGVPPPEPVTTLLYLGLASA